MVDLREIIPFYGPRTQVIGISIIDPEVVSEQLAPGTIMYT